MKSNCSQMNAGRVYSSDFWFDVFFIVILSSGIFAVAYHPAFFGDELTAYRMAFTNNNEFYATMRELNHYKPRLLFNGIEAYLAIYNFPRYFHGILLGVCMAWINVVVYWFARRQLNASREIAWLLIFVVLSSRYGVMLYYDYLSGFIELFSTALLLSAFVFAWLAWYETFRKKYAFYALVLSILSAATHERYAIGALAVGAALFIAELLRNKSAYRKGVFLWIASFSILPLMSFVVINVVFGGSSITTGTAGQKVVFGGDVVWTAITYSYNVFLNGNYGFEWYWGRYTHLDPLGKWFGILCVAITLILFFSGFFFKKYTSEFSRVGMGMLAAGLGLIAIASLVGSSHQGARFMFPVGILLSLAWVAFARTTYRYAGLIFILAVNLTYFFSGSYNSISSIYSSRAAHALSNGLNSVVVNGRSGIVIGNEDDLWTIGGGDVNPGDTFSRLNLSSEKHLTTYVIGTEIPKGEYDFGLQFDGFNHERVARYRYVSVSEAAVSLGLQDVNALPTSLVLGNSQSWNSWNWNGDYSGSEDGVKLSPHVAGFISVPVSDLQEKWIVYTAKSLGDKKVPMRLQINWHALKDNRFIAASIEVVQVENVLHSYSMAVRPPAGAEIGYVYAGLHDGAAGAVDLKKVELKLR